MSGSHASESTWILEGFTFEVPGRGRVSISGRLQPEDRLVVRGPSGCGKTTFLRALAGLHTSQSRTFSCNAVDQSLLAPGMREIALVFQDGALLPHLSVWANVSLGLRFRPQGRDLSPELLRQKSFEVLDRVGLSAHAEKLPNQLSGGERSRVGLARAWISQPKLFLLDEAFSSLDPQLRSHLRGVFLELQTSSPRKAPAVIVTHDADDELQLSTKRMQLLPWQDQIELTF